MTAAQEETNMPGLSKGMSARSSKPGGGVIVRIAIAAAPRKLCMRNIRSLFARLGAVLAVSCDSRIAVRDIS